MLDSASLPTTCPKCEVSFLPARSNQQYCTPSCQKNGVRGSRKATESPTEAGRSGRHYQRAKWLAHDIYGLPPNQRLGFMAKLIEAAREHDTQLRSIFTDPVLLSAGREDRGLFHRKAPLTYKTIAQAADAYCRKFWGYGVRRVIYKECPEPETGEIV
jgi:hypothetical protein